MKLILLGPPGAGKGTIAKMLIEKYKLLHISTGDLLRDAVSAGSKLGKEAQSFMISGKLVPDEIVIGLIKEKVKNVEGFILDGFPRTIPQADALKEFVEIDTVVNFDIAEDEIVRRLTSRRTCAKCGAIYNLISLPPKIDGECDKCNGELFQRDDDNEDTIRERFNQYKTNTQPLIDYYLSKEILIAIPAHSNPEDIFSKVVDNLKH